MGSQIVIKTIIRPAKFRGAYTGIIGRRIASWVVVIILLNGCFHEQGCTHEDLFSYLEQHSPNDVRQCLQSGQDVNLTATDGSTPLIIAAKAGDEETVKILLSFGADVGVRNKAEENALRVAQKNNHQEVANAIKVHSHGQWAETANKFDYIHFEQAIVDNNDLILGEFISHGQDVLSKNDDGIKPIVSAIFNDSPDVVTTLLANGANPNDSFDFRPLLSIATMFGQIEIVSILIEKGANVDETDGPGMTALMFAVDNEEVEVAKLLIEAGANCSILGPTGQKAKEMATLKGNEALVAILASKK